MQVALIPPYKYLDRIEGRNIQMILPSCLKNPRYRFTYKPMRMAESFVLMDNGMFENDTMTNENLIEMIAQWEPDEIVMPDVQGDMMMTLAATERFLRMYEQVHLDKRPKLQIVIQISNDGKCIPQFIQAALNLQESYLGPGETFTFGIPRRLAQRFGPFIRMNIVDWLDQESPNSDIHLLGYARNGDHPEVFNEVRMLAHRVRSIDTDAPFVWAHKDASLRRNPTPYERPENYYELIDLDPEFTYLNIETLDEWARG